MAGFRLLPESHLLVLACDHTAQKPFGLLADALPTPAVGHTSCILFFAVFPQANLSDNALKQVLHVMMKRCRCLNELAVKYHSTGTSLCKTESMEKGKLEHEEV